MFKHRGKSRTFRHNFRLAAFLSFTAGMVNICGVLSLGVLTTNVTGHFAYFAEGALKKDALDSVYFLFYILAFLFGSFISNLLTELFTNKQRVSPHSAAMFLEIFMLLIVGIWGDAFISAGVSKPFIACILLFAMGVQNSLVSKISNSTVRTTHLTGLFTDLGIELSQLFFYKEENERRQLWHSIGLRGSIIAFFFSGCVAGGFLYSGLRFKILLLAVVTLIIALMYDNIRLSYYRIKRLGFRN